VETDRDHDGILDADDTCPDEAAGTHPDPDRHGCAIPDEDGDGVLDADDACPGEAIGKVPDPSRNGCPFTDSDGDKITDVDDKCPTLAGPPNPFDPAKHGCPELARIAGNKIELLQPIAFEVDGEAIKDDSVPVLQAIATILKNLETARVRIDAHTDDKGSDDDNLDLSKRRAHSVAQWLVINGGINDSRLEIAGYGRSKPFAAGATSEQNRRIEIVILDSAP